MILGSNITADDRGAGHIGAFTGLTAVFDILSLVDDAVGGYDGGGRLIIANENLADLSGLTRQQLIGIDVDALFLPVTGIPSPHGALPFPLDGREVRLLCRRPTEGTQVPVAARAKAMGDDGSFLLVVRSLAPGAPVDAAAPGDIAVDQSALEAIPVHSDSDLAAAEVVEGAVSAEASCSHNGLAEELRDAVDAQAAAVYITGPGGFALRGTASDGSVGPAFPPSFTVRDRTVSYLGEVRHAVAFERHRSIEGDIVVLDHVTGDTFSAPEVAASCLSAYFAVPILYDGSFVALALVGWATPAALHGHDAKVLDILGAHHGSELMSATMSARLYSNERLQAVATDGLMRLESLGEDATLLDYYGALESLATAIGCSFMPVFRNLHQETLFIKTEKGELVDFPFALARLEEDDGFEGVRAWRLSTAPDLRAWLDDQGIVGDGVLVTVDRLAGERRAFLFTSRSAAPLSELSVTYLKRFVQDVHRFERRRNQRAQDSLISHTLQNGMGNHLQKVEGVTAQAIYNSATETANVGGDFYDLIRLPDNRACVILGDVAGKGVQSASVSAAVRTALGAYAWEGLNPAHMVRSLNDFFLGFSRLETFATLFVAVIDVEEGQLTYCSAGHPPALLIHPRDQQVEQLNVQSGVVGAFREMIYKDGRVKLRPGDELLLYTDGVTEARSPSGDFFGEVGLRDAVVRDIALDVHDIPDRLMATLYDFTAERLDDDVAIMALRFDGLDEGGDGRDA